MYAFKKLRIFNCQLAGKSASELTFEYVCIYTHM